MIVSCDSCHLCKVEHDALVRSAMSLKVLDGLGRKPVIGKYRQVSNVRILLGAHSDKTY